MRYFLTLLALLASQAQAAATHCTTDEQVLFSCKIAKSSKTLSLCASKDLAKDKGTVSYRFGKLGKIELAVTDSAEQGFKVFTYSHYFRAQTDYTFIAFKNNAVEYQVFDSYDGENKPHYQQGVTVLTGDAQETTLLCDQKIDAHLEKLRGILQCNKENPLFDCE
jgi:hypothetical protein